MTEVRPDSEEHNGNGTRSTYSGEAKISDNFRAVSLNREHKEPQAWQTLKKEIKNKWNSYELANRELFITSFCMPAIYYKIRWKITQLFHYRVFTLWSYFITIGELIFFPGIVIGTVAGSIVACSGGCNYETTGNWACIPMLLAFVFSSKNSIVTFLTGAPYERLLIYHKFFAIIALALSILHGVTLEGDDDDDKRMRRDAEEGGQFVIGIIFTCFIGGIIVCSFFYFRRYFFEAFLRLHYLFIILIIVFALLHEAPLAAAGAIFWGVDVALRLGVIVFNRHNSKKCVVTRLPGDVVRITFPRKTFKYRGGQHLVICVPSVSLFEWHPFSISSAPHEDNITLHIRVLGDWTNKFHKSLKDDNDRDMTVFIDGPYGSPSVDLDRDYKLYLFISGGIGITPMQSIVNELLENCRRGRQIHKILFVWSVRDTHMISSVLDFDKDYYEDHLPKDLPSSFQPDLLSLAREEKSDVLESSYHLTKLRSAAEFDQGNISPSIQSLVKFGRPHLSEYFERMFELAKRHGESKVAVMTCGPGPLTEEANQLSSAWSKEGITFHFHEEVFEF